MKFLCLVIMCFFVIIPGCAKNQNDYNSESNTCESFSVIASEENNISESIKEDESSPKIEIICDADFLFYEDVEYPEQLTVSLEEITRDDEGCIYRAKIDFEEDFTGRWLNGHDRFILGYFWQTEQAVFYLDELELTSIPSSSDFIDSGSIVYVSEEYMDNHKLDFKENDYLETSQDYCVRHYWDPTSESGYYRTIGWDREKGLIVFRNGFGSMMESITLYQVGIDFERYE